MRTYIMMKKILSAVLTVFFAFPLTLTASLAVSAEPVGELNTYTLIQNETDGYGHINSYFVDENGNKVQLEEEFSMDNSVENDVLYTAAEPPTSFNLADEGYVSRVKAQGASSSCWAFAALGALESNAMMQGIDLGGEPDFSEAHLVWFAQNSATTDTQSPTYGDGMTRADAYAKGGNWLLATNALARWSGTVKDESYPFYPYNLSRMGKYPENERCNTSGGVILESVQSLTQMTEIKQWIMETGAVEVDYYYHPSFCDETNGYFAYYSGDNNELESNHSVLIVGWDDNYSVDNFHGALKPKYPGAFLCKNSWGNAWGENGYFWLSYFDSTISGLMGITCVESDTYDNNYSYNGLAYSNAFYNDNSVGTQVANVFTSKGYETLSAVSTYTVQQDVYAEVFIYKKLPSNYSRPNQGTLAYSSGKTLLSNAGYHTIKLGKKIDLNPNEIYSVVIRFTHGSNRVVVVMEDNSVSSVPLYSSKTGQSFIDQSGKNSQWYDSLRYNINNLCIQAFTVCRHQYCEKITQPTCETSGHTVQYCLQCNRQFASFDVPPTGHSFSPWSQEFKATKANDGKEERYCETCGYTETKSIPKITNSGGKKVGPTQFAETLKMMIENIIIRIRMRFEEKDFYGY